MTQAPEKQSPIHPTDDQARSLARDLIDTARYAALAVIGPDGAPVLSRVGFGTSAQGQPVSLISDLAAHAQALRANPLCSLMVGEPGPKGDPLTHPRLTLQARACFVTRADAAYEEMAAHYLRDHPKSKLYIGFADFNLVQFDLTAGFLNGGFGQAFQLTPDDLARATS